jgi:hypothetical protein
MIFARLLRRAGVPQTTRPAFGDIAMVVARDGSGPRGAIVTSGYVVLAQGGGLARLPFDRARRLAGWSVNA